MKQKHGSRSTIVPGRKPITQIAALHDAGVTEDMSYCNEKSVLDESSNMNDTHDNDIVDERSLIQQGIPDRDINKILQRRKLEKLLKAQGRLERQMLGAKTFKELLEKHEYSERESGDENNTAENISITNKPVFAIPALPKHFREKSMMGSPIAGSKGSGKAGLSCSTPKSVNDISMRSLRILDISHVVNTDQLYYDKVTVHNKNVLIPIVENTEQSSVARTKMGETFTVRDDQCDNKKHGQVSANEASDSPIGSIKLDRNCISKELIDTTITENIVEGGKQRRRSNKVGVQERERRHADLNSSLMNSMIEEVPSPGAKYFKNPRKKVRPIAEVPPKVFNMLSVESDKEKTIEMLSIVEEVSIEAESNGPSFVDPLSVNGSHISPIPEVNELMNTANVTPKSSCPYIPILGNLMETVRVTQENDVSSVITPKLNYLKPTISSLRKNINAPECDDILFGTRRERCTPGKNATTAKRGVQDAPTIDKTTVTVERITVKNDQRNIASNEDLSIGVPVETNRPSFNLELEMGEMSVRSSPKISNANLDSVEPADFDPTEDRERVENQPGPFNQKSSRNRVALLSDSIATVNTPVYDYNPARCRFMNYQNVEEPSRSDVDGNILGKRNPGKNRKNDGLQLKKREIIEPDTNNGNRRSTRTRVKPLRFFLGERAVYVNSPNGGKRLTGVTTVIIKDKRLCKYRTGDLKLATEREQRAKAFKKKSAAGKRKRLLRDQQAGRRMDESSYDIHTDDEQ
ncbi:hypothetical protein GCK72_002154 [Caenorhabditis remanei]|uniref:Uncharacterized protein n=1 Tax=Caenorhabditis remanei TaxID=31234 RepID=A0A6A5HU86_CAERE|nr:hypothetical protein GCK72_002154 [Caenorhabditis remanei]KAF1770336.1 hypothetical protein GCK72_002154 [Caenorhabditis remanei]